MKIQLLRTAAIGLFAISFAFAGSGLLLAQKPAKTITVTGVVKKFDATRDRVLSVYIQDPEQGKFLLARGTEVGKALLKEVGAKVKATGKTKESHSEPEFEFVLDVLEYEVLEPARPPASGTKKGDKKKDGK